jgi:glyoxylase-like metal-dependent hydrolase (beta-lactamase superfamily II)
VQLDISAPGEDFDKIALDRALDRLTEIVPGHDNVRVTVTNRFEEEVRAKVDDPEYAAVYEQEGQFAVTMAKTITHVDQSTT